mmetsp:Transcript_1442/g.3798  ORF Transcript_1442/g.3798 Transcript_1442/m.3798 type:complete len:415 (+) Transcript_1442:269-1513(+)
MTPSLTPTHPWPWRNPTPVIRASPSARASLALRAVVVKVVYDLRADVNDFEDIVGGDLRDARGVAVGDVEALEDGAVAAAAEPSPGLLGKNGVRDEGRDLRRAGGHQRLAGLEERATRLHEIVHDAHGLARGVALLDRHAPLVAVANLPADDDAEAGGREHVLEALRGAVVGERHAHHGVLAQARQQRRDGGAETRDDARAHVEAVLQRVQVVEHEPRRPPAERKVAEHPRVGVGRCNGALFGDALHGAHGVEGQHDGEALDEALEQHNHDAELRQRHVVVVERAQEQDVGPRDHVLRLVAPDLDLVRAVRKLVPDGCVVGEALRRERLDGRGHALAARPREQLEVPRRQPGHEARMGLHLPRRHGPGRRFRSAHGALRPWEPTPAAAAAPALGSGRSSLRQNPNLALNHQPQP